MGPHNHGTLHIREALKLATSTEMENLPDAWKVTFPQYQNKLYWKNQFWILNKHRVKLTKDVSIGPFDTVYVSGNTSFWKHSKRLNIMVERLTEQNQDSVVPIQTYTVLKPGST